jgi:hypothetical protein
MSSTDGVSHIDGLKSELHSKRQARNLVGSRAGFHSALFPFTSFHDVFLGGRGACLLDGGHLARACR